MFNSMSKIRNEDQSRHVLIKSIFAITNSKSDTKMYFEKNIYKFSISD